MKKNDFGYKQVNKKEHYDLIQNIFTNVASNYDLMNDLMSLGIHRLWKKNLLNLMNPSSTHNLIDVACGTGDIAKLFLESVNKYSKISCVDPNKGMIKKGKEKLREFQNINWVVGSAEKLPFKDNIFDTFCHFEQFMNPQSSTITGIPAVITTDSLEKFFLAFIEAFFFNT